MPSRPTFGTDPWSLLNKYRERYDLDSEIPGLMSLKMSLDRRRARRAALNHRLNDLANQLEETTSLLKAVNREIEGAQQAGAILFQDAIDQIKRDNGEGWSPIPVLGYRAWNLGPTGLIGSRSGGQRLI